MVASDPDEETCFSLGLEVVWYTKGLNRQAEVLSIRQLVEVPDADEGGLAGEEGLGGLESWSVREA